MGDMGGGAGGGGMGELPELVLTRVE